MSKYGKNVSSFFKKYIFLFCNIDKIPESDIIRSMPYNIDYFIDYCKYTQIYHFLKENYKPNHQYIAKGGADKRASVSTGKPEIKRPLEATVKNKLERELGSDLPDVTLHIGGYNERLLDLFMAYALTYDDNIYIREESYKEGSEETDKILLHEAVHVLQNKNNVKIKSIDEKNKAEAEAEQAEHDWTLPQEVHTVKQLSINCTH